MLAGSLGPKVFSAHDQSSRLHRLLNREHLEKAHAFFEKHGGKAIVIARFVPIVRTFVPFVAGAGYMSYSAFAFYNVTGAILWVASCFGLGYLFGNIPIVKQNFSAVALLIIFMSVLPVVWEFIKARRRASAQRSSGVRAATWTRSDGAMLIESPARPLLPGRRLPRRPLGPDASGR